MTTLIALTQALCVGALVSLWMRLRETERKLGYTLSDMVMHLQEHREAKKSLQIAPQPYRDPQLTGAAEPPRRSYCIDCRFVWTTPDGRIFCRALPQGQPSIYGQCSTLNQRHDCQHFDPIKTTGEKKP